MESPPLTIGELQKDWEQAGPFLRRRDASPKKPSPLLSIADVLGIAQKEIDDARNTGHPKKEAP